MLYQILTDKFSICNFLSHWAEPIFVCFKKKSSAMDSIWRCISQESAKLSSILRTHRCPSVNLRRDLEDVEDRIANDGIWFNLFRGRTGEVGRGNLFSRFNYDATDIIRIVLFLVNSLICLPRRFSFRWYCFFCGEEQGRILMRTRDLPWIAVETSFFICTRCACDVFKHSCENQKIRDLTLCSNYK